MQLENVQTVSIISYPQRRHLCSVVHRLLDTKHFLLPLLGGKFHLESAIGTNGRVWINAKEPKQIIAVARCIEAVDPDGGGMDAAQVKTFLETLDV